MDVRLHRKTEALVVPVLAVSVQTAVAHEIGLFWTTAAYDVGNGPVAIARYDLNKDWQPDVVTSNGLFGDTAVLLNDKAGSFFPQVQFGVELTTGDLA